MKKEYRGKFGNFVHEERKKEEETLEICEDILKNSRNEMAVAMPVFSKVHSGHCVRLFRVRQMLWELTGNCFLLRRHGF